MNIDITPNRIQPAFGNLVYQFSSTAMTSTYKYRFIVDVYVEGVKQTRLKITPQNTSWAQVDISPIIQNYVSSKPINVGCTGTTQTTIPTAKWGALENSIISYNIIIGDEYSTTPESSIIINEPSVVSETAYAYNGAKNWYDGKEYDLTDFYLSNYSLPTEFPALTHKFLTNAPRVQYITDDDWATLTGLNMRDVTILTGTTYDTYSQSVYSAVFEFYDENGAFISSGRTYNVKADCGQYDDCSDVLSYVLGYENHYFEYIGSGPKNIVEHGITVPTNWKSYRVYLEGIVGQCLTWYVYNPELNESLATFTYQSCPDGEITELNLAPGFSSTICSKNRPLFSGGGLGYITGECSINGGEGICYDTQRISEYFYYYRDPECGPGNRRVMWLSSFGTWEYFTFKYRDITGYDMSRQYLTQEPTLYTSGWDSPDYYGWNSTNKVWSQQIQKTGLLYSGRISKSYLSWMTEELMKSPSVYFVDGDGDIQPIVLTNTEVVEPNYQRNDGEYELILEYRGGYNETRQDKE